MFSLSRTTKGATLSSSLRRCLSSRAGVASIRTSTRTARLRSVPAFISSFNAHQHQQTRTMSAVAESAERPNPDKVLVDIADYIHNHSGPAFSDLAIETARLCLIDTVGCGLEALRFKHCANLLGPVVEGTVVPNGMCIVFSQC